ncbi:MAG: hypothetical protein KY431_03850 [Actinobacteria bacterium]|nr:hypothetical protein [Actinomycetota bacterium]
MPVIERLRRRRPADQLLTAGLVVAAVAFTFVQLQPRLLLSDTLPAGGDMGAHVWGPAFLRDHLLPQWRLSGWSPDWYAGFPAYHFYMVVPSLLIVALDVVLPYTIAFKLISVSGLLALPVAAWALGRLGRLPFPGPGLLAVAAVPFIFDRSFTIYGGNAASTLAGEFAFSISLALAVLFLGLVLRGLATGRHRALAAVVLALCALCHIIPAIFALVGGALAVALRPDRSRLRWALPVAVVGGLLTSFWTVPFVARRAYLNDMGWEKLTTYWESLFPGRLGGSLSRAFGGEGTATVAGDLTWVAALAIVGVITSIIFRRHLGMFLGLLALVFAVAFVLAPQGRLWNARLLPFWYLCLYLLAAVAVAEFATSAALLFSRRLDRPNRAIAIGAAALAALAAFVAVGLPLRALPFGEVSADGSSYSWAGLRTTDRSFISDWARWNYSGYQGKAAYPEFRALLSTMDDIGEQEGCGRAMWEYDSDLDRFGTPMALMLLPYATEGCIGSMEGLYFEASATTPFHFLNQSELSLAPSRAQRDLPYGSLDVDLGVDHLQLLGVRYYMAFSPEAVRQADAEPELTPVATSGSWRIYRVADAELVEPLDAEPAVLTDVPEGGRGWLEPAVDWYLDRSTHDVFLAASGPPSWPRISAGEVPEVDEVPANSVSNITTTTDSVSFDVERLGTPVLVKASYFPNWEASGAEGPWRAAPNLMVVVPTATHVELRYGTTWVEWTGWALSLAGLGGLVLLMVKGPVAMADRRRRAPTPEEAVDTGEEALVLVLDEDPDDDLAVAEANTPTPAVAGPDSDGAHRAAAPTGGAAADHPGPPAPDPAPRDEPAEPDGDKVSRRSRIWVGSGTGAAKPDE